jgi:hypothetical protein
MKKSLALLSVLALAACSSPPPPITFAPLDYSYLRPIVFKVATLNVVDAYTPGADEAQLNSNNPAPPGPTLMAMLNKRMQPSGQPGTGTITVQVASITESDGNLNGEMTVDVNLTSADGRSTGFAEASVSASQGAPDSGDQNAVQTALYQMTKKLMDSLNVQLPYQIAHDIPTWVAWTNPQAAGGSLSTGTGAGVAPGAIQATPLTGPPGSTALPSPAVPAPAVPASPGLVPPAYLPGAGPTNLSPTTGSPPP